MELSDASKKKSPVTRPGIDPATFRLVAQCLNRPHITKHIHISITANLVTHQYRESLHSTNRSTTNLIPRLRMPVGVTRRRNHKNNVKAILCFMRFVALFPRHSDCKDYCSDHDRRNAGWINARYFNSVMQKAIPRYSTNTKT